MVRASRGELHVWWARSDSVPEAALDLLGPAERERYSRLRFDESRRSHLAAHAMLRILLQTYAHDVADAPLERGIHGKPSISGAPEFNLSHTRGVVACIFAAEADAALEVGIDVEIVRRTTDWRRLMPRVMCGDEIESLLALPVDAQQPRFYELWTMKEAWAKARGEGLQADFRSMNVLAPPEDIFLSLLDVEPGFKLAVAARGPSLRVLVREFGWPATSSA